jgi:hypothetical protein
MNHGTLDHPLKCLSPPITGWLVRRESALDLSTQGFQIWRLPLFWIACGLPPVDLT